jgi:hypothetical protein
MWNQTGNHPQSDRSGTNAEPRFVAREEFTKMATAGGIAQKNVEQNTALSAARLLGL